MDIGREIMEVIEDINLKSYIVINKEKCNFEIYDVENGLIKAIKLNNDIFVLNNGFKQSIKTKVRIERHQGKKKVGRPALKNTKLIKWIDSKGKNSWDINDFLKKHPECERNKDRVDKQLSMLIELKRIIQLDNNMFRKNI